MDRLTRYIHEKRQKTEIVILRYYTETEKNREKTIEEIQITVGYYNIVHEHTYVRKPMKHETSVAKQKIRDYYTRITVNNSRKIMKKYYEDEPLRLLLDHMYILSGDLRGLYFERIISKNGRAIHVYVPENMVQHIVASLKRYINSFVKESKSLLQKTAEILNSIKLEHSHYISIETNIYEKTGQPEKPHTTITTYTMASTKPFYTEYTWPKFVNNTTIYHGKKTILREALHYRSKSKKLVQDRMEILHHKNRLVHLLLPIHTQTLKQYRHIMETAHII